MLDEALVRPAVAERIVALAMGTERSGAFLRQALALLELEEAAVLLLLTKDIMAKVESGNTHLPALGLAAPCPLPSLNKVAEWSSAVIDAHFTSIVVASVTEVPLHKCLRGIQAAVKREVHAISVVEELKNYVALLMNCKQQKSRQIVDYSVEVLCM